MRRQRTTDLNWSIRRNSRIGSWSGAVRASSTIGKATALYSSVICGPDEESGIVYYSSSLFVGRFRCGAYSIALGKQRYA